jgi:hypothetical protein
VYLNTDYQRSGAGELVRYINRGADRGLRNAAGRRLADREVESFVSQSERHQFERGMTISPDPEAAVSRADLERATERHLRDFMADRRSVSAVYAVHDPDRDVSVRHAHVALTGKERDLYLDRNDLERQRSRLAKELEPGVERDRSQEQEQEPEPEREIRERR